MKIKEILNVGNNVRIYKLNTCIDATTMFGTMLYRGCVYQCDLDILDDKESVFNSEVFRIFDKLSYDKYYIVY